MSAIQTYLRDGGKLEDLTTNYGISCTRHKKYNNLILFKYDQINSPPAHPLVVNARGTILDETDNWRIVCARFNRFFNYGEGHAATIDWSSARVQEKVDGSLVTMYWYDNKWHVATSGSPDASGQVGEMNFTFADLFWKTFNQMGLEPVNFNTDLCPSFELTSMFNRVVVPHKTAGLTFIGLHDRLRGGNELPLSTLPTYPAVKSYPLNSFDEIVASFANIDPISQEGYVAVDGNGNRVKVKHPGYVALHHLKDGFGPRRIVEIIRASEKSEVLTYFPEWTEQFNDAQGRYDNLVRDIQNLYDVVKDIPVQKDFALAVQARRPAVPAALYRLRARQINTVKEHLADMPIQSLMKVLGMKDKEPSDDNRPYVLGDMLD